MFVGIGQFIEALLKINIKFIFRKNQTVERKTQKWNKMSSGKIFVLFRCVGTFQID